MVKRRPFRSRNRYTVKRDSLKFKYNRNQYIKSKDVRLIDSDGSNHGVVSLGEALKMANEQDLDLVELGPNADPPVCRIISWSKFLYEQKRKDKKQRKNKQKSLKEVRFGARIAENDQKRLVERVKEFLDKGHNVKITIKRKGRTPPAQSRVLLDKLLTLLSDYSTIDARPSVSGRWITLLLHSKDKTEKSLSKSKKVNINAETKNKQNSSKKVPKVKPKRGSQTKDNVQQKSSGASKDQKIITSKKQDTK